MYHCHVQLYLVGDPCRVFEIIKEIAPLPAFIHTFVESENPEAVTGRKRCVFCLTEKRRRRN